MKNVLIIGVLALVLIGGWAYWAQGHKPAEDRVILNQMPLNSGENPQPGSQVHDLPVEPAAALARKDLARTLSVDEKSIVILMITDETWTDGCLGLGGPAESCLQALVPGFRVEMVSNGKSYFYRTDKTGSTIRPE